MTQKYLTTEKENQFIEEATDRIAWLFVELVDMKYKKKKKKNKKHGKSK